MGSEAWRASCMSARMRLLGTSMLARFVAGAVAGVAATAAMSTEMALAKKVGLLGEAPPHKLTQRLLTLVGARPRSDTAKKLATTAMHLGYGAAAGALFALLPRRGQNVVGGSAYGIGIWATSYVGWIPKLGLMRSPSRDRTGRPTAMVLAHVVYGAVLGKLLEARG